jgi:hypothetical protein
MYERGIIMEKSKKKKIQNAVSLNSKEICRHDYKNAIQVGNVDYVCPLCMALAIGSQTIVL